MKTFAQFRETVNETRVDKHELSGKVVIDGHVFNDAGKSGRTTYGRYSTPDPDYKKDPKEAGMHRNYRKPSSLSFSTLGDAKKWVKTQPKKSAEDIDATHKKYAEREKMYTEQYGERIIAWREKERPTNSFAIQGHQVHADSDGMKIYHGGELIHHYKGDYSNPTNGDKQKARLFIGKRVQNMKRNEDYENPYRFDWGTPEGTAYMKKKTPKMKFELMYKDDCKCNTDSLPATKKL